MDKTQARLNRRGDCITLGESCANTATVVRHQYGLLEWPTRELNQWSDQMRAKNEKPTFQMARQEFSDSIFSADRDTTLVTDWELQEQIDHPKAPAAFAMDTISKRLGLSVPTIKTYLYRKPCIRKKRST